MVNQWNYYRVTGGGCGSVMDLSADKTKMIMSGDTWGPHLSTTAGGNNIGDVWQPQMTGLGLQNNMHQGAAIMWSQTETNVIYYAFGDKGNGGLLAGVYNPSTNFVTWSLRASKPNFSGNTNSNAIPNSGWMRSNGNLLKQDGSFLFAGTYNIGILRSSNTGGPGGVAGSDNFPTNCTMNGNAPGTNNWFVQGMAFDNNLSNTMYAAVYNSAGTAAQLWQCTNTHATTPNFTNISGGPTQIVEIFTVGAYVYCASANSGIWQYGPTNGSPSWRNLNGSGVPTSTNNSGHWWCTVSGYVDGSNNHIVIIGDSQNSPPSQTLIQLKITSNGAGSVTYTNLTGSVQAATIPTPSGSYAWWIPIAGHLNYLGKGGYIVPFVYIDASNLGSVNVYAGGSSGFFRSLGGGQWTIACNGMNEFLSHPVWASKAHTGYAAQGDSDWGFIEGQTVGGIPFGDGNHIWNDNSSFSGPETWCIAGDFFDDTIFAGSSQKYNGSSLGALGYRAYNNPGAGNWTNITSTVANWNHCAPLGLAIARDGAHDNTGNKVCVAGISGQGMWRWTAAGGWAEVDGNNGEGNWGPSGIGRMPIKWAPNTGDMCAYEHGSGKVFYSTDTGQHWYLLWTKTGSGADNNLAFHPTIRGEVWISTGGGLYKITNAHTGAVGSGATLTGPFTAVGNNGPVCYVPAGLIDATNPVVVCTTGDTGSGSGIQWSKDDGAHWHSANTDGSFSAAQAIPEDMDYDGQTGTILVGGTNGITYGTIGTGGSAPVSGAFTFIQSGANTSSASGNLAMYFSETSGGPGPGGIGAPSTAGSDLFVEISCPGSTPVITAPNANWTLIYDIPASTTLARTQLWAYLNNAGGILGPGPGGAGDATNAQTWTVSPSTTVIKGKLIELNDPPGYVTTLDQVSTGSFSASGPGAVTTLTETIAATPTDVYQQGLALSSVCSLFSSAPSSQGYTTPSGMTQIGVGNNAVNTWAFYYQTGIAAGTFSCAPVITDSTPNLSTMTSWAGGIATFYSTPGSTPVVGPAPPIPNGTITAPYSETFTATGGTGPYTFSVRSGSLPPGLALGSSTGILAGTLIAIGTPSAPTVGNATSGGTIAAGMYKVTVTYVNQVGETVASAQSTTTTTTGASTITINSPAALNNATGWYAYVSQVGGSTLTRQQAPGSPTAIGTNLTLTAPPSSGGANAPGSDTTGIGTFNFTIGATDVTPLTGTQAYSITVGGGVTITTIATEPGQVAVPYSQLLSAVGGTLPHTWTLFSGTLPPGVLVGQNSLSGIPTTAGTYNFTLQVADSGSNTATQSYTLVISTLNFGFPTNILDLQAELNINGVWSGITPFVYSERMRPTIKRGHPDESDAAASSTLSLELNNTDFRFSPHNPNGTYYPYLGRNTPIRLHIPDLFTYLRLEEDQASFVSTPPSSSLNISGDMDLRLDCEITDGTGMVLASKWATSSNNRGWAWRLDSQGFCHFDCSTNGVLDFAATSSVPMPWPGGRLSLRVTYTAASGNVSFYYAQSIVGPWIQVGTTVASGMTGTIFASTAQVMLGYNASFASIVGVVAGLNSTVRGNVWQPLNYGGFNGKIFEFEMMSGIGGTVVADANFQLAAVGSNQYTDGEGNIWTLGGTATFFNRNMRFYGEVPDWTQKWDPTQTDVYTNIVANGLLRRLGQNDPPFASALTRFWTIGGGNSIGGGGTAGDLYEPVAYWPGEDGNNITAAATQFLPNSSVQAPTSIASGIFGQPPMGLSGKVTGSNASLTSFASDSSFLGSYPLPVPGTQVWSGTIPYYKQLVAGFGSNPANVLRFLLHVPTGGDTNNLEMLRLYTAGTNGNIRLTYDTSNGGELVMLGRDRDLDTTRWTSSAIQGVNGIPMIVEMALNTSGGNVAYSMTAIPQGDSAPPSGWFVSGTDNSASIGRSTILVINPKSATGNFFNFQSSIGQFAVQQVASSMYGNTSASLVNAPFNAWDGEAAGVRVARLCNEQGLQFRIVGWPGQSNVMGPQSPATFKQLLTECEAADRGMLFEPRTSLSMGYRCWHSLTDQLAFPSTDPLQTIGWQMVFNGDGSTANPRAQTVGHVAPVTALSSYNLAYWVMSSVSGVQVTVGANFYNPTFLSKVTAPLTVTLQAYTPTLVTGTIVAPATATSAQPLMQVVGTPLASTQFAVSMANQTNPTIVLSGQPYQGVSGATLTQIDAFVAQPVGGPNYAAANLGGAENMPMEPVDDDMLLINDEVVTLGSGSVTGSSYEVTMFGDEYAASSVLAAIESPNLAQPSNTPGVGVYQDTQTINLWYDVQMQDIAAWIVHSRTVNELRYPTLPYDLTRGQLAALYYNLLRYDIGDLQQVLNLPPQLSPDAMRAIIFGMTERLGGLIHNISFQSQPASVYDIAVAGSGAISDNRADAQGISLSAVAGTTDTTINTQLTPGNSLWTTNQNDLPFDIIVGGERMTVVSVAGPPANLLTGQNAGFDGGIGNWVGASNCTVAPITSPVHSGTGALQVTSSGASTFIPTSCAAANITTQGLPCHPNDQIVGGLWALAISNVTGRVCSAFFEFFQSNGTFISTLTGPNIPVSTSAWNFVSSTVTAPALSAFFLTGGQFASAAGSGEVYAVDDAFSGDYTSGQLQQTLTVIRSVNGVVKSHAIGEPVYLFQPVYAAVT